MLKNIILGSDSRHLWYLITLFGIFLVSVFVRPKNKRECIITILIMVVLFIIKKYFPNVISQVLGNLVYFYIGYFFNLIYKDIVSIIKKIKFLPFALVIIYCILFYFNINSFILSISGICMAFTILLIIPTRFYKDSKVFNLLKSNSMGIYLFHPMIIYVMYYLLKGMGINDYIQSILIFGISIIFSILFTYLIKLLRLQFILGEKH